MDSMEKHDYLKIGFNLTHPSHFSFHNFLVEELCQISWILSLNLSLGYVYLPVSSRKIHLHYSYRTLEQESVPLPTYTYPSLLP
jgi:hypothetical protein